MKLIDIYNKINACPRKMGSLQILCALGDAHREGQKWIYVSDLPQALECDPGNISNAVAQMLKQSLIERLYMDNEGEVTDKRTKKPVIRLIDECQQALGA